MHGEGEGSAAGVGRGWPRPAPLRELPARASGLRKIDLTRFTVATSETARHINRRIALNLIRRHQPLSRADVARRSGLQRSTVSAIVDQLIADGWVSEGAMGRAPRGRRPRFLHLNAGRVGILGVELRPQTTTVGLAGLDARFLGQASWPTPRDPAGFVRRLARTVADLRLSHPGITCEGVGVSLPGRVDGHGRLVFAPNLGWRRVNLRTMIEAAVSLPVTLENAANACALAELWFGDHADRLPNVVAVTVSEGLGVGLLLNGQLVHGAGAMAGEFGHITLHEDGPPCSCGKRGCWERYASNSATAQYYAGAGTPPDFTEILGRAAAGEARAGAALDRMAGYLGAGIAAILTGLAPDLVVVVGEVTGAWDRVGPLVAEAVRRRALPHAAAIPIRPAGLATQPRLRGAVTLVVQQHFGAPHVA